MSYVPELRRLKLQHLDASDSRRTQFRAISLKYLSDISLKLVSVSFNQFEQLIRNTFYQVQVLHVSIEDDITYLDDNRWEQLMLSSMPRLRVFHMNNSNSLLTNDRIQLGAVWKLGGGGRID